MPDFKSVLKSIARGGKFVSMSLLEATIPATAETLKSSIEMSKDLKDFAVRGKTIIQSQISTMQNMKGNKDAISIMTSAFDDLKKGLFSSDEYYNDWGDYEETPATHVDGEDEPGYGDITKLHEDNEEIKEAILGSSRNTIDAINYSTQLTAGSNLKGLQSIGTQLNTTMVFGINKINTEMIRSNTILSAINQNMVAMVEFNNRNVAASNQAMMTYFDKSLEALGKLVSASGANRKKQSSEWKTNLFSSAFNFGSYKDHVKDKLKKKSGRSALGGSMGAVGSAIELMQLQKEFDPDASIVKMLSGLVADLAVPTAINAVIPKNIKFGTNKLDDSIQNLMKESLKKLGDMKYDSSKNPTLQMLGSLFGMERSSRKIQILDISKYNKGATSWNGIAQKTLVEVIPNYLARIEAALSNKEERYFDHTKGRFSTASEITDIFEEEKAAITKNALRETSSSIDLFSMKQTLDPLVKRRLQTKISEAFKYRIENRGRGIDEDYRKKINDAFRGTHFTPRQKDDIIMQLENAIEYSFDEYESYFNRHAAMNEDGMAVVTNILNKERRHTTSNMSKKLQNVIQTENESLESKRTFSVRGMQPNLFDSSILLGAKTRSGFQITNRIIEGWIKDVKGDVIENLKTRLKDRFEEYDKDIYDFESLWIRDYDFLEGLTKLIKEMTTRDDDINIKKEISVYWSNKYIDRMSPWKRAYNKLIGGARHPLDDELTSESTILKRMGGAISGLSSKINKVSTGITYTKDGLSLEEMRKFQEEEKSTMNKAVSSETINLGGLSNSNISQTSPLQNTWIDIIANGVMAAYKTMGFDNIKSKKFEKKRKKGSSGPAQSRATESDEQGYTFKSVMGNKTSNIFEEMGIEDNDSEIDTTINFDAPIPESIMNATHQSIEQDTYRDAEDLERLFRKESKKSGEKSFLNVVKGSLVTMMNSFTNMTKSIFGKDGVAGKIFQNEHFQKFWKYLFDKDTGKFKGVINRINDAKLFTNKLFTGKGYTNSKGKEFEDTEDNVKENMKGVYDFLFKNTMKGTMGDDYEDHKMYQKYLSRLNIFQSEEGKEKDARIRGYHGKSIQSNLIYSRDDLNEDGTMKEDAVPVGMRNNDGSTTPFRKYHSGTVKVPGKPGEEKLAILQAGEKVLSTAQVKMQEAKENLGNKMADHISGVMDAFFGDKDPKEMISEISDKFRKALPKAVTGGILGTIVGGMTGGSLFGTMILGGLGGPILGAGIGFLSQSDKFKDMIFGKMNDGGKREGGLITQAFQEKFKKAIPTMVTGGVLGLLKSTIFGSFASATPLGIMSNIILGPLGGAALGIGFSLLKNSETFQNTLFGPPDENGQRKSTMLGNLTNTIKQNVINAAPMLKKGLSGAVMGGVGAGLLGSMGFLPSMFAIGGPIGGAIAGAAIGIGSTSKRFQEMMFGTEEVDSKGNPTGKRLKDGILSKMQAMLTINVMEPIKDKVSEGIQEFGFWMREDMMEPFIKAFGPIIDGFADMKDDVSDFLKDKMTSIAEGVTSAIKKTFETIFSPIGDMIKFATKSTLKLLGIGAKMTGAMLAAPIKMVSALMAPKRAGEYLDFYNQYGTGRKDITEEEQEEMRNQSFGKKLFGAAKGKVKSIFAKDDDFDQARDDYNDDMTKQKRNTLNWRNSGKRMKALREERKQAREDRRKWGKVDNIRKELAGDKKKGDAYNQEKIANWSDRHFASVQKRLRRELGDDAKGIETREDIKNLIYNREQWKSDFGYSPIKAGSPQSLNEQMVTANELSQKQYEENKTWRESYFEKLGNVVESAFRKATGKEKNLSSEESNEINDIFNDLKTKDLVDKWKKNSSGTADMFDNSVEKLLVGILQGVTATTDAVELEGKRQQDRDEKDIATQKAIALGEKEGEEGAKARGLKGLWKNAKNKIPFIKKETLKDDDDDKKNDGKGFLSKLIETISTPLKILTAGGFKNPLIAGIGALLGLKEGKSLWEDVIKGDMSLGQWFGEKSIIGEAFSGLMDISTFIGKTGAPIVNKISDVIRFVSSTIPGLPTITPPNINPTGPLAGLAVSSLGGLYLKLGQGVIGAGNIVATLMSSGSKALDTLPKNALKTAAKYVLPVVAAGATFNAIRQGGTINYENADAAGNDIVDIGQTRASYAPTARYVATHMTGYQDLLSSKTRVTNAASMAGKHGQDASEAAAKAAKRSGWGNMTNSKASKSTVANADDIAATGNGIISKAVDFAKNALEGMMNWLMKNPKVAKIAGATQSIASKIGSVIKTISGAGNKVFKSVANSVIRIISLGTVKEASKAATLGIGYAIFGISGAISGASSAANIFGVRSTDVTPGMKTVASIVVAMLNAVPGLWALELVDLVIAPKTIRTLICEILYGIFAGEDGAIQLSQSREKMDMQRSIYNEKFGTELSSEEFNDMTNKSAVSKFFGKGSALTDLHGNAVFDDAGALVQTGHGLAGLVTSRKDYARDNEGNVLRRNDGKAIMAVDKYGNKIQAQKLDKDGNKMFDPTTGEPILEGKRLGDYLGIAGKAVGDFFMGKKTYKVDEFGQVIYDPETGKPLLDTKEAGLFGKIGGFFGAVGKGIGKAFVGVGNFAKKGWEGLFGSKSKHALDENGEFLFDENGNPIMIDGKQGLFGKVGSFFGNTAKGIGNFFVGEKSAINKYGILKWLQGGTHLERDENGEIIIDPETGEYSTIEVDGVFGRIGKFFGGVTKKIGDFFGGIGSSMGDFFLGKKEYQLDEFGNVVVDPETGEPILIGRGDHLFKRMGTSIGGFFTNVGNFVGGVGSGIGDFILGKKEYVLDEDGNPIIDPKTGEPILLGRGDNLLLRMGKGLGSFFTKVGDVVGGIGSSMGDFFLGKKEYAMDEEGNILYDLETGKPIIMSRGDHLLKRMGTGIGSFFGKVGDAIGGVGSKFKNFLFGHTEQITDDTTGELLFDDNGRPIMVETKGIFGKIGSAIGNTIGGINKKINEWKNAKYELDADGNPIPDPKTGKYILKGQLGPRIVGTFGEIAGGIMDTLGGAWDGIKSAGSWIWDKITNSGNKYPTTGIGSDGEKPIKARKFNKRTNPFGMGSVPSDLLGDHVRKFESGTDKNPGKISTGALSNDPTGDPGGPSFGAYQFPSYWHADMSSVSGWKGNDSSLAKFWRRFGYDKKYPNTKVGNNEAFKDAWKKEATDNSDKFYEDQWKYVYEDQYYKPTKKQLNFDPDTMSRGIQEMVWSTAVQYGSAPSLLKNKYDENKANDYSGFINRVQDAKLKEYASGKNLKTRIENERSLLLGLANTPPWSMENTDSHIPVMDSVLTNNPSSESNSDNSFGISGIFGNLSKVFENFFASKVNGTAYQSIFDENGNLINSDNPGLLNTTNMSIPEYSANNNGTIDMGQHFMNVFKNNGAPDANISSEFGLRPDPFGKKPGLFYHSGTDIATGGKNPPIPSPVTGEVVGFERGSNDNIGSNANTLKIKDAAGYIHRFTHMTGSSTHPRMEQFYKTGAKVKTGDVIGYVGTTGDSTGMHLHYDVTTPAGVPQTVLSDGSRQQAINPRQFKYDSAKLPSDTSMRAGLIGGIADAGDIGISKPAKRNNNIRLSRPGEFTPIEHSDIESKNAIGSPDVTNSISNDGLRDALKGAISTGGIEDKLDAIIGVMSSWFDFDKENSDKINMNLINNKNQTPVVVQSSNTQTKDIPDLKNKNLRQIHEFIARGRELSVK